MKKILFSISGIVAVGAMVIFSTGALFSDTETSAANVFTAGSIDLKVDHLAQSYDGVDCKTCGVTVVSDSTNTVVEKNGSSVTPYPAVPAFVHPNWTAQNDPELVASGAGWIWEHNPTRQEDTVVDTSYSFQKEFTWFGPIVNTDLFMAVGSDNGVQVFLNNVLIGSNTGEFGYLQGSMLHIPAANITGNIIPGNNVLKFVVTNMGLPNSTPQSNPAGLIYKFSIDGKCGDNFFKLHCTLFGEKDLTSADHFWQFNDIKPGDFGTNLISLHPTSNDAYVCLFGNNLVDQENTLLPVETTAGDAGSPTGELSQFLKMFAWSDDNHDGVYQASEATLVTANTPLATGYANLPIVGGSVGYVGIAWCAGTQSVVGTTISCDGSGNQNVAQTDSSTLDVTAYAVQQRNNPNFSCADTAASFRHSITPNP